MIGIGLVFSLTGCVLTSGTTNEEVAKEEVFKKSSEAKSDQIHQEGSNPEQDKKAEKEEDMTSKEESADVSDEISKEEEKPTKTSGTTEQIPVVLVKTVDGDTIKVKYNGKEENIRYLLIDTPETSHPSLGKQPLGPEAKERNKQLVNSGELTIEFDVGERYDKYSRLLAYVFVDGKMVQETLVKEGLARVAYVYPPNTRHLDLLENAQDQAKSQKAGIWAIEDYVSDSGFNGDVVNSDQSSASSNSSNDSNNDGGTAAVPTAPQTEYFKNCTELRKKYPNGVPKGHAAYQSKMDRDNDNYACER
ncbi:MAG: thermonuclease family protein [Bacillota bacterium]